MTSADAHLDDNAGQMQLQVTRELTHSRIGLTQPFGHCPDMPRVKQHAAVLLAARERVGVCQSIGMMQK